MFPRTALASALLLAVSCFAQIRNDSRTEDASIPKIVKQTQLVYVPVVVEDKKGHVLRGLTKDSFMIEQDGKQQSISVFEEIRTAGTFSDRAPSIGPGVVENFALSDTQARKSIIIVVDTLNTPFLDQSRAKAALVNFVAKSLQRDQPVALMVLSYNGLHQIHSITADPNVLMDSVKRLQSHYNRGAKEADSLNLSGRGSLNGLNSSKSLSAEEANGPNATAEAMAMMEYLDAVESHHFERDAALTTLQALEQLAGSFVGIPGRKSVIWATAGFPFNIQDPRSFNGVDTDLYTSYERTWKRLNDANIAIYPIDITGLTANPIDRAAAASRPTRTSSSLGNFGSRPLFDPHMEQQMTLISFASATGGRAFLNSNDIQDSFAKAAQEADGYYLLAYYLHSGEDHPGWHKLKVHVKGEHADVRARNGFYIGGTQSVEKDRLKELTLALRSPVDYTGVHFGIRLAEASASNPTGQRVQRLHVSFPPGSLLVDSDKNNLISADFAIIAVAKEKVVGQTLRSFHMNLTPMDLQKIAKSGLGFDDSVDLPTGEYEVRVAVRDLNSDKIGTLRTYLIVH